MNKKLFVLIIILMSFALIGIVAIQGYWIKTAVDDKEETFSYTIQEVLTKVSDNLEETEFNKYIAKFAEIQAKDSLTSLDSQIRDFVFVQENKNTKETFIYRHGILEEDYSLPTKVFDDLGNNDTTIIKNYLSRQSRQTIFGNNIDNSSVPSTETYELISRLPALDKILMEESFNNIVERLPIINRVSPLQLELLINQELKNRNLDAEFEYAIYNKNILSNVRSKYFDANEIKEYKTPLFVNSSGSTNYELAVVFPEREQFLLSSIIGIASLSIVFTIIIIVAFSIAVNQLITQRKISEIKTDFINNMT